MSIGGPHEVLPPHDRCANGSSGPGEARCGSRYIRVERLEETVKSALADLLASPGRLLDEARRAASVEPAVSDELTAIVRELDEVDARQRRLVQLFTRVSRPARGHLGFGVEVACGSAGRA